MFSLVRFVTIFTLIVGLSLTAINLSDTAHAASFTAVQDGTWHDSATWGGGVPTATDSVTIPAGIGVFIFADSVDRQAPTTIHGTIFNNNSLSNSATIEVTGLLDISNTASLANSGTINIGVSGNLHAKGSFSNDGTLTNNGNAFNDGTLTNNNTFNNSGSFSNIALIDNYGVISNTGTIDNLSTILNRCGGQVSGNPVQGNPVSNEPCPTDTVSDTPTSTPTHTLTPTFTASPTIAITEATQTPTFTPTLSLTPSHTPSPTCAKVAIAPGLSSPPHRAHTTDTTPAFSWGVVINARSYRLMVYLEDRSFEFKKRVFMPNYMFNAGEALVSGKYLWRVRTQDLTCNTWSNWSKRNTLFID